MRLDNGGQWKRTREHRLQSSGRQAINNEALATLA
jgi:hypothetical protein